MIKHAPQVLAAVLVLGGVTDCHAGLLSALRNQSKDAQQQEANATPQPTVPPPAEQAARGKSSKQKQQPAGAAAQAKQEAPAQPEWTPDPSEVKAGARRLSRQLSWDPTVPADLFQRYAGKWDGYFWTYSPVGKKEGVQKVQIAYENQPDGTMKMTTFYYDMISKVWVTEETAIYTIDGDTVNVTITGPVGKPRKQTGHYADNQLFLKGVIDDGVEHFRERIEGKEMLVDGFAVYKSIKGNDNHVFIGRFKKQ